MTIEVKIIRDSVAANSPRLTTMQLRYPRFIHAEFMTHRVFSRNASSSRAIPVERMIADIIADTAMPLHWGANQGGMQADAECDALVKFRNDLVPRDVAWRRARDAAVRAAKQFSAAGYHKQIVNRLLEPFAHISVVVTATEWDNFFALRCHPDAQPEIQALANAMRDAMNASTPHHLKNWEWHLPYVRGPEMSTLQPIDLLKISAARCARVSYLTHDGKAPSVEADLKLYERLASSRPMHASPLEHQAIPTLDGGTEYWGNFSGWDQFRKMVEDGCFE
jgi:thymidylate synthase ThyX